MGDRHDYVALDWVKGEISDTLNQARQALEAFVDNPEDTTRLRFCLTYIHQVHGTLQMVEFYGAALLAEEMEKLAQGLMHGECSRVNEALQVLMQAILQLPVYLDRVQSARRDQPLLLLPLLNDMRTARGEKLLSENALFSPVLGAAMVASEEPRTDFSSAEVTLHLRRLRQAMQIAHAAIIREQDVVANSQQLGRVFARLERLFQGAQTAELWAIFAGVAEGLEHGTIDNGASIRQLLRQADRELRQAMDEPESIWERQPDPDLLRNLLFYVAKSGGNSQRLEALSQHYRLHELWNDSDRSASSGASAMVGPDRNTMELVAEALGEELLQVKERLDLFVRSSARAVVDLESLLPHMKRIADTLAVLGLGQPRRVLQEQIERVEVLVSATSSPSDTQLMEIAGGVLYVEASTKGILAMERVGEADAPAEPDQQRSRASTHELQQIQQQVVLEARNALEQTREAINAFIAGQWDHTQLEPVDDLLNSVRGGLAMLPLPRAAAAVAACRLYLCKRLLGERQIPDWEALDALADVIASIDYYLERLADDNGDRGDSILAVAEERLAQLGYASGAPENSAEAPASVSAANQEGRESAGTPVTAPAMTDHDDEEGLDPELIEIFIEEVGEVLETLDEYTPQWQADTENLAARAEVRRAFHTLKGSGRMVQAGVLAELAWAVENMLNRVIDGNAGLGPATFTVINAVRALMPGLAEDYAQGRQQSSAATERLAAQADALARGESLPEIDVEAEPIESLSSSAPEQLTEIDEPAADVQTVISAVADDLLDGHDTAAAVVIGHAATEPALVADEQWPDEELAVPEMDDASTDEIDAVDAAAALQPSQPLPELEHINELEEYSFDEIVVAADVQEIQPEAEAEWLSMEASEQDSIELLPAADESSTDLDPLLLKIFRNETQGHIEQINAFLDKCAQGLPCALSDTLQRALHTLKGSAHMAGIQPVAILATPLEKLAKDFKSNLIPADQALVELLRDAVTLLEVWLAQSDPTPEQQVAGTDVFLQRLEAIYQDALAKRNSSRADLDEGSQAGLLSIFLIEGIELLLDASDELTQAHSAGLAFDHQGLARVLGGLADVAMDVELQSLAELSQRLEDVHEALAEQRMQLNTQVVSSLVQVHERLIGMMDQVAAHQHIHPAVEELALLETLFRASSTQAPLTDAPSPVIGETGAGLWHPGDADTDAELVDIFLEEAQEILDSSTGSLQDWLADTGNDAPLHALLRDLHTLKGGALMAEIRPVGDLTHELEYLYEGLAAQRFHAVAGLPELLLAGQDALVEMVEGVVAGKSISDGTALIGVIREFRANPQRPPVLPGIGVAEERPVAVSEVAAEPLELSPVADTAPPLTPMLAMFVEEAIELLEPCRAWLPQVATAPSVAAELLHRIQSLKGSARLAGQNPVAELARSLETALQQDPPLTADALGQLLNELEAAVAQLSAGQVIPQTDWGSLPVSEPAVETMTPQAAQQTLAEVQAILQKAMQGEHQPARNAGRSSQETIKVPADLLEDLVNLAGETSIFRGRIEQQVSDISQTLSDMESTIERVRDQLRRLDMETQAQILSRHQEEIEQGYEEFDPLEMDRYSQLQQLSRSLFESASDMLDLKETLAAKSRDAETLLVQQARVNTELQEGLMRTRMVPFERLLPRLRRVVRQVSSELGKQVVLAVGSADGEMDRSVLERMMGPLEHMLRNAVDHGIELPRLREERGKPEEGTITLDLRREGSEIVIQLVDDGGGVDLDSVRNKAVEHGLMDADAVLTDQEVLQFILEAGFSTAQQVTQISGRGVGMDVVNSEIKQLGGSMTVTTEAGSGTTFVIRLPFTVSVNRALMVYSGDDLYAIPLNTIEGIVRVSGYELEAYYAPDAPPFEYAGKSYDLRYLGDLLITGQQPKLSGHSLPLPVILVRGAEHTMAVQVDALAGSREIVVKSLGKQFAVVPGISGATILGDGRVVVILDLLAVIRAQQALYSQQQLAAERAAAIAPQTRRLPLVMVVDDSITVRKVTTRLLERHGMEVVTAKDGIEAMARLQDLQPDLMLLDIEMPRMDGFEVATLVRHDERLQGLPIIMITSRTGEKHRERAFSLGVNEYLGKPYQEGQLLEVIGSLVSLSD